jgi:hypothetical protein
VDQHCPTRYSISSSNRMRIDGGKVKPGTASFRKMGADDVLRSTPALCQALRYERERHTDVPRHNLRKKRSPI